MANFSKGPSIFPILFAGIVGRALKACASYQAGRGAKLGVRRKFAADFECTNFT